MQLFNDIRIWFLLLFLFILSEFVIKPLVILISTYLFLPDKAVIHVKQGEISQISWGSLLNMIENFV